MNSKVRCLRILGIRGVPAAHGGFETFAEHLALFLKAKGWRVVVYCQHDGAGSINEDEWQGIERVNIPVRASGPKGTIIFDWLATLHASRHHDLCLTLGYNTAIFCALLRIRGVPNVINMDGIEWSRAKWGGVAKAWFWTNERVGCWLGNHLVADHPAIAEHLSTRVNAHKITMIAYGGDHIADAAESQVRDYGLTPGRYLTVVARPEPENSILEVVEGFSRKRRGMSLAVLGRFDEENSYHRAVKEAASAEVVFLGAIYEKSIVRALRFHSAAYVHGHQVGGTNPSLVEALGAGNPVFAHDNRFNRWVAGEGARYFKSSYEFGALMDELAVNPSILKVMAEASSTRFQNGLTWPQILSQYELLLNAMSIQAASFPKRHFDIIDKISDKN